MTRLIAVLWLLQLHAFGAFALLQPQQQQSIQTTPVVICPGFGNDQIDYYEPLQQPRQVGLIAALERRGFDPDLIFTIPVQRSDWIRVAGGLLDWKFYANQALPTGNGYGWYLKRFQETVDKAYESSLAVNNNNNNEASRVLVIGHSAGGWLARAGMGGGVWDPDTETKTADRICGLVTVGAIHKPPVDVGSCVTRGALAYTDQAYPGAFLKGIGYVSVGGDAIVGDNSKEIEPESQADSLYATRGEGSAARVAFTSYDAVCGTGDVTGDGVVPLEWTALEGAKQLKLDGVLHSINEAGTTIPTDRWYGSEGVIDRWLPTALEEAGISTSSANSSSNTNANTFDLDGLQKWASGIFQQQQ
ncbi:PGAP1-like protein [Seminavis robusta]|uniref:PGAP1-like protein n=1 Tax=Seminavis robusta TaxID=568900 RepID=A0A9N8E724_9STRA|nr:PGAP1-like protein [Seminavis robusta]|eukprot:Sro747_g196580.1 PGAP1-like protein (360) ;mRNA; f:38388-39467